MHILHLAFYSIIPCPSFLSAFLVQHQPITRLYEDNVSGKISDECFEMMSKNCEVEQKELRQIIPELSLFIEASEQKKADTEHSRLTFASVSMLRSQLLSLTVWFTTKKERLRRIFLHNLSVHTIKLLYRPSLKSEAAFLFVYQSTDYFGHDA